MVSQREDRVWVLKEKKPVAIPVQVGITDGRSTEVTGDGVSEGLQVLVGVEETKPANQGATRLRAPGGRP
jgi:HlyD family secretion protein